MDNIGLSHKLKAEGNSNIGRISSQYRNLYKVIMPYGEILAEISGKIRFKAKKSSDFPAVGDFVILDNLKSNSNGKIIEILPRKTIFVRKIAGKSYDEQVIATNIDYAFICMSLNNDFNLRRLERYLAITWESGATPIIVLTKSDLCLNINTKIADVKTVAIGVDIIVLSSLLQTGFQELKNYMNYGKTIVFIGSSGVGKSTIVNNILGNNVFATNRIDNKGKGRHTTTNRELVILPEHGVLIDTPGMRELGLESANIEKTFIDIDELANNCRFNNCSHSTEPGCFVQEAIRCGTITLDRLESFLKLKKELVYQEMNSRQIELAKNTEMFQEFGGIKNARKAIKKQKNKR